MKLICLFFLPLKIYCSVFYISRHSRFTTEDSAKITQVNGQVLISNVGFAPVPAFSFDSPIAIGFLSIKNGRFSYQPDFAVGLNGKPWMTNHWFRFAALENQNWTLRAGVNPSLFFKNEQVNSVEEIVHAHRNITIELATTRNISKQVSLTITYMHIKAFDQGTLSGDFIDLSCPVIMPGFFHFIDLHLNPQFFYFDFEGNIDGLYTSNTLSLVRPFTHNEGSLSAYFQGVLPLKTDFSGNRCKWSAGVIYAF